MFWSKHTQLALILFFIPRYVCCYYYRKRTPNYIKEDCKKILPPRILSHKTKRQIELSKE